MLSVSTLVALATVQGVGYPAGAGAALWIPSPFGVWRKPAGGRWGIVLTGTDVGNSRLVETLEPGRSEQSWFILRETGEMRLELECIFDNGENTDCSEPPVKWKKVKSQTFAVREPPGAPESRQG
jgi:hypothetical protein